MHCTMSINLNVRCETSVCEQLVRGCYKRVHSVGLNPQSLHYRSNMLLYRPFLSHSDNSNCNREFIYCHFKRNSSEVLVCWLLNFFLPYKKTIINFYSKFLFPKPDTVDDTASDDSELTRRNGTDGQYELFTEVSETVRDELKDLIFNGS